MPLSSSTESLSDRPLRSLQVDSGSAKLRTQFIPPVAPQQTARPQVSCAALLPMLDIGALTSVISEPQSMEVMAAEAEEFVMEAANSSSVTALQCFELYGWDLQTAPATKDDTDADRQENIATQETKRSQLASCLATPMANYNDRSAGEILQSTVRQLAVQGDLKLQSR